MKRRYLKAIGIMTTILLFGLMSLYAELEYTPRELIVKLSEPIVTRGVTFEIEELDTFLSEFSVKEIKSMTPSPQNRYYVVRVEETFEWNAIRSRAEAVAQRGRADEVKVEYIQPNYLSTMLTLPNDPLLSQQFLDIMKIPQAWKYETGSEHIIVAIVDSGLWFDHPEFEGYNNIWINESEYPPNGEDSSGNGYIDDWRGWNFVDAPELADIALGKFIGQDNEPFDETGHGTHIAGIIGATTNNNEGIAGVCWNVKMMILRAGFRTTTGAGYLQDDDAAAAIIYAADNGAHVMNLSWGSVTYSQVIADACQYAYDKGVIIVASAGNTPEPKLMYPAKLNTTIAVGSVDNNLNLTGFSSYGSDLDIVAPGQNVLSSYLKQGDSYYQKLSGTSMSSPYVAAAVALLLSAEPGLTFDEVTSRLFTTTRDLGETGFDNLFGHGLLDVEKLLTTTYKPYIEVSYPLNDQGQSESFQIMGSIKTETLLRYSVMFTEKSEPSPLDWKDVETHQNNPKYYDKVVENGVIANFFVPYTLADNDYLLRIRVETLEANTSRSYEKRFRVNINKSIPGVKEDHLDVSKRYKGNIPSYYIKSAFDQTVSLQIDLQPQNDDEIVSIYSNYADSLHILQVPERFPEGGFSYRLIASNISGLQYESDWYQSETDIKKEAIPTDTFFSQPAGPPLISVGKSHDFYGNGLPEFLGMEITEDEQSGAVKIYELQENRRMALKHTFEESFLPIDLGNTDKEGMEVFGLILDEGILFDTYGESLYPNQAVWSLRDVVGGNFCDWNDDGTDDLLLIRNFENEVVVSIYERSGNFFIEKNILRNTSPTDSRNSFTPRVAAADLNGNGFMNVLTADTDGDVMVYEIYDDKADSLIYHHRMSVPNAYHVAIGDFTGDGNPDFCIGGYSYEYTDPNKIYWHFDFFTYNYDLKDFELIGYLAFDHFESVNAIKVMNLIQTQERNDKQELILALTPHLYVVGFEDGEFKPLYAGESHSTYQVVPIPSYFSLSPGFVVNAYYEDKKLYSHFVTSSDFTGPPAPKGLVAKPIDESTIQLEWDSCSAEKYYIFREDESLREAPVLIDSVYTNSYIETELEQGVTYHYVVQAYNSAYEPPFSQFSAMVGVTPYAVPKLISIEMSGTNELRLLFDTQLSNDAVNIGYYVVNNDIGMPSSVNHTNNHQGLLLRFFNPFIPPQEEYFLLIDGLLGRSGVPFPSGQYSFEYKVDLTPPEIVGYQVINKNKLEVSFSKAIQKELAEQKINYELAVPLVDPFNQISSIQCTDSTLSIGFETDLKISNQSYSLKMLRIEDTFGNQLKNNENILRFRLTDIVDLEHVQVYPNPFVRNQAGHNGITFIGLLLDTIGDIRIYSLAGDLIYHKSIGPLTDSKQQCVWTWDGKNKNGKQVSSGTYFYVIKMDEHIKKGQLVIVN